MRSFICSICVLFVIAATTHAQTPTVSPISGQWWSRTGNIAAPNSGNVIGTFFSSPFYLYTDSFLRMRVNKNLTTSVNSLPAVPRNGYIGIGNDLGGIWSTQNPGPFSLLHLNGNGTFVQQFGYRNWMQTGITFTSNNDFAYIGQKQNTPAGSNVLDVTDFVVAWGDNATAGTVGPDVMKFVFTSGTGSANTDLTGDHPDGREIMRLTGFGNVGIGPRFNNTPAAQPQAMLHLNSPNNDDATLQMTTQGAGQQSINGLLMKVSGANRDVWFSQQEDANMLFFTGTNFGNGGERMRISSTGAGNPASLPANLTRIGISHSPGSVTHPLSLLHLGYDTTGTQHNGWRPWMDVGTFTAMGSDGMYVGLKIEQPNVGNLIGDRHDAVIAWGDNENPNPPASGPDYLRFIFATTPSDPFDPLAASPNGREIMRLTPSGNAGIGDYTAQTIGAKLDIDGDLRIRTLTQDNNLTHILVADPGDLNRVHWRDASTIGSQFFSCPTSVPADKLSSNSWWELNNFNFVFAGQGGTNNSVGIGTSCTPGAKLHVNRQLVAPALFNPIALRVDHSDVSTPGPLLGIGTGIASVITGPNRLNYAGDFSSQNANVSIGVRGTGTASNFANFGGWFSAAGTAATNIGVFATAPSSGQAGYFNGNVTITGTLNVTSDKRLKKDIQPIANALAILSKLQPRTFFFDPSAEPRLSLPRERQYGVIAQDVAEVLPEVVKDVTLPAVEENERATTIKSVNYEAFIGLLIAGMQQQQTEIDQLRAQVEKLTQH